MWLRSAEQEAQESIDSSAVAPSRSTRSPAAVLESTVTSWAEAHLNQQPVQLAAIRKGLLVPVVLILRYLVRPDGQAMTILEVRQV